MVITESNYIELMKSCSKFNSRITGERKTRYPYFDQQTGTAHRPSIYAWRKSEQRYPATDPDYVCSYPAVKWRKNTSAPPADATEMKMFLHNNQQLTDAINQAQNYGQNTFGGAVGGMGGPMQQPAMGNLEAMALIGTSSTENSLIMSEPTSERRAVTMKRETAYDDYDDDPDDLSDFGGGGDSDDDFGAKRKKGKSGGGGGASAKKKKASGGGASASSSSGASMAPHGAGAPIQATPTSGGAAPSDEKRHACNKCGARYKSRPGLSYHKAHVHGDGVQAPANVLAGGDGAGAGAKRARPVPPPLEMPSSSSSDGASSPAILPPPVIFSPSVDISDTCDFCDGTRLENKKTKQPEELVTCHDCGRSGHPSCLNFTENMRLSTSKFGWQCIECKSCAICGTSDNDDKLLFCDDCDRGFHLYCLRPPLEQAPDDAWSCHLCMKVFGAKAAAAQPKK